MLEANEGLANAECLEAGNALWPSALNTGDVLLFSRLEKKNCPLVSSVSQCHWSALRTHSPI